MPYKFLSATPYTFIPASNIIFEDSAQPIPFKLSNDTHGDTASPDSLGPESEEDEDEGTLAPRTAVSGQAGDAGHASANMFMDCSFAQDIEASANASNQVGNGESLSNSNNKATMPEAHGVFCDPGNVALDRNRLCHPPIECLPSGDASIGFEGVECREGKCSYVLFFIAHSFVSFERGRTASNCPNSRSCHTKL